MPAITIYQKPTCTTCRKVYQVLKDSGVQFDSVNYYVAPISKSKLENLLSKMKLSAVELLRRKESIYKELKLADKQYTQDEVIDFMVKYPDLIQRPIVERGNKAILARPAERSMEILSVPSKKN